MLRTPGRRHSRWTARSRRPRFRLGWVWPVAVAVVAVVVFASACSGDRDAAGPVPVLITKHESGLWTDPMGLVWFYDGTPAEGVTLVDEELGLWSHYDGSLGYVLDVEATGGEALLGDAASGVDASGSGEARGDAGDQEIVSDGPAAAGSETGTEGGEPAVSGDSVEGFAAVDTTTSVVEDVGGEGASQRSATAAAVAQMGFVSAGSFHSCGIRADGAVECWGNNDHGKADAPDGAFVAVAAGGDHSCGVRVDQNLECWGSRGSTGSDVPEGGFVSVSTAVGSGATGDHSCGLRTDGRSVCWGFINRMGRLGAQPSPDGVVSVSAGGSHWCSISTESLVSCRGNNFYGQADPPAGGFVSVSGGQWHTCGVRTDGNVECWGNNSDGQTDPPTGVFVAVSGGGHHSCGLRTGGAVECWGDNDQGQTAAPAGEFAAVSAGGSHTCGLRTDGAIQCWGDDRHGQSQPPAGAFGP